MNPNIPKIDESVIQENSIGLLKAMGYVFIPRNEMQRHRKHKSDVLLKTILFESLERINGFEYKNVAYPFSSKNISKAIDDLDVSLNEGLMTANQKISEQLLLGHSYIETVGDAVQKSFSFKYIDFENVENNVFHFSEEFSVNRMVKNERIKTRRPDLVLFVNGIAFAVIELKRSSEKMAQGISQMLRNQGQKEILGLFKFVQMTLAGNNHTVQYGTTGTIEKFYAVWNEQSGRSCGHLMGDRAVSRLDETLFALFEPKRALELMGSYVIFDNKVKKIARYQQYFAIRNIMKSIQNLDNQGRRAGGLIWHTQGSGKSLTMVMLAKVIKKEIVNAKIVIVTDRKDLDRQIHTTFNQSEVSAKRAKSGHDLLRLIQGGTSVITTIINKFETVKNEKVMIDDPNIFILVDESHRTQGGDMHKAMKKVFPSSCYLGFTGTPLMKKEKSSFAKFGGEIAGTRYTIDQAVKDKAVLPLLYEGRLVEQWISDDKGLDRRFEKIARGLNEAQTSDLKKRWARFQHVASSERRLEMIMFDISEHFSQNIQGMGFKGMLATSSKYEALKYHSLFEEEGNIKTAFVISAPDTREGHTKIDDENKQFILDKWSKVIEQYGSEEVYNETIKDQFIKGEEIEILIVVDKLLTGFDAPRASVLYIDKLLKEHNLLQAIARVNRLHEGKDFGFIIDYRGLLGDLDKALSLYSDAGLDGFDAEDLLGAIFDIKEEIAKVKTYDSYLEELFKEVAKYQDQERYEVFLGDKEKRKSFYEYLSLYARALKLSLSSDKIDEIFSDKEIEQYKAKMKFYSQLRANIQIRYHEKVDFGKYEKQMQKLLDTFISAKEVNQLTKLVNIFDEEFDQELERVVGSNAKADSILSASTAIISEKMASNPDYYERLSKRIELILQEYRDKRLSEEEKLKQAKEIREILDSKEAPTQEDYPQSIGQSSQTRAFYDNLKALFWEVFQAPQEEVLAQSVLAIHEIFIEASKKPEWKHSSDMKKQIEGQIEEIFWDLEDLYELEFTHSNQILATIQSIGIHNY